jgi:hypothetical protein
MKRKVEEYKIWHLGDNFSAKDADTLTTSLNIFREKGWEVVSTASTYILLARYAKPGRPKKNQDSGPSLNSVLLDG